MWDLYCTEKTLDPNLEIIYKTYDNTFVMSNTSSTFNTYLKVVNIDLNNDKVIKRAIMFGRYYNITVVCKYDHQHMHLFPPLLRMNMRPIYTGLILEKLNYIQIKYYLNKLHECYQDDENIPRKLKFE